MLMSRSSTSCRRLGPRRQRPSRSTGGLTGPSHPSRSSKPSPGSGRRRSRRLNLLPRFETHRREGRGVGSPLAASLDLDLRPAVRLDLWAATVALGIVMGTVSPALAPGFVAACGIVCLGALAWRCLVPEGWRVMALTLPLFALGGVGISSVSTGAPDPLQELAAIEPGDVVIVGIIA